MLMATEESTDVTQWHDIETFYITIIQEQLSAHSAAASQAEMSTSLILCFSCLVLCITARNFRSDYNYEYYEDNQWNDTSNDYHYQWRDHTEGIGQTYFEKYSVIGNILSEERGQSFWRTECRLWAAGEIYLQGDKVPDQYISFLRQGLSIHNGPGPTWRQVLCCQVVDIQ